MGGRGASFERQGIIQLKKGIRSLSKQIERHADKIANPSKYVRGFQNLTDLQKRGLLVHWKNEIAAFERIIEKHKDELAKRGEKYD